MEGFTVKAFHDFLRENKIMGSRCKDCEGVNLPPRPVCPVCGGRDLEWVEIRGKGVVEAYTVITVPLTKMSNRCPYAVGVVKMDGGPSVSGLILGVTEGDDVSVGSRVVAEFVKEGDETVLCFRQA